MNRLCEIPLSKYEQQQILTAYTAAKNSGESSFALEMFAYVASTQIQGIVYLNHAAILMRFAQRHNIEWLEQRITSALQDLKQRRTAARSDKSPSSVAPSENRKP